VKAAIGIDIGSTRVRIAYGTGVGRGSVIEMLAARDLPAGAASDGEVMDPELVATVLEDMLDELRVRTRECVFAVGPPVATLRAVKLPRMNAIERDRAARIDVERRLGRAASDVVVRTRPLSPGADTCLVGAVAGRALRSRSEAVRRAGLRARAVDFEGSALARAFPAADAVLDVGLRRITLHAIAGSAPTTLWSPIGGATMTQAIREDLGVEERSAESRKRSVGIAGAGEAAFSEIVGEAATLLRSARARGCTIERVALFGNGSRVAGLCDALERGAEVRFPFERPAGLSESSYPDDVAAGGAADWALAIGLARWEREG
jgi:Tfp pilus assembly PilM family ATPase